MDKKVKTLIIIGIVVLIIIAFFVTCYCIEYYTPDEFYYLVDEYNQTCSILGPKHEDYDAFTRIPEKIGEYTVVSIEPEAFKEYETIKVILPDTITKIGEKAFYKSEVTEVIGLDKCMSLTVIEAETFRDSYLQKIKLPESIISIGDYAFLGCVNLEKIKIPQNTLSIGMWAFGLCSIEEVYIPASVANIEINAFGSCYDLEEIDVDENNPYWRSVDGVLYTKNMEILYVYPSGKPGREFSIPAGVKYIANYAFGFNSKLEILNIPNSIFGIEQDIFVYVTGKIKFNTINYDGTVEMWKAIEKEPNWNKTAPDFTIYCTDGTISKNGTVNYN